MPAFRTVRRVTIYADGSLEATILDLCLKQGARGYTVLAAHSGKGLRTAVEGRSLSGTPHKVRIEIVAEPAVAEAILTQLSSPAFARRPVLAVMDSVEVGVGVEF
jgi:hypothetical protein